MNEKLIKDGLFYNQSADLLTWLTGEEEPTPERDAKGFAAIKELIDKGVKPSNGIREQHRAYAPEFRLDINPPYKRSNCKQVDQSDTAAVLASLKNVVKRDEIRTELNGVYCDGDVVVATDAHILVQLPHTAPEAIQGKTVAPVDDVKMGCQAGDEIGNIFPNYKHVIPQEGETSDEYPLNELIGKCAARVAAGRWFTKKACDLIDLRFPECNIWLDAKKASAALKALQANGVSKVVIQYTREDRAVVFIDTEEPKRFALVMPVLQKEGSGVVSNLVDEEL